MATTKNNFDLLIGVSGDAAALSKKKKKNKKAKAASEEPAAPAPKTQVRACVGKQSQQRVRGRWLHLRVEVGIFVKVK